MIQVLANDTTGDHTATYKCIELTSAHPTLTPWSIEVISPQKILWPAGLNNKHLFPMNLKAGRSMLKVLINSVSVEPTLLFINSHLITHIVEGKRELLVVSFQFSSVQSLCHV